MEDVSGCSTNVAAWFNILQVIYNSTVIVRLCIPSHVFESHYYHIAVSVTLIKCVCMCCKSPNVTWSDWMNRINNTTSTVPQYCKCAINYLEVSMLAVHQVCSIDINFPNFPQVVDISQISGFPGNVDHNPIKQAWLLSVVLLYFGLQVHHQLSVSDREPLFGPEETSQLHTVVMFINNSHANYFKCVHNFAWPCMTEMPIVFILQLRVVPPQQYGRPVCRAFSSHLLALSTVCLLH